MSAVNLANAWLNVLSGTTFTAPANTYVKLHTGDPGSAGATAASANTTRVVLAWAAPSPAGTKAIQATLPVWATWAAGSETISHISIWDNLTVGNFLFSVQLTASKPMTNGDTLNLTALSFALTPLAA